MKQKLNQRALHKYCKARLGYSSGHEISPYHVGTKALELDGFPFPSAITYKKWVLKNADYINAK